LQNLFCTLNRGYIKVKHFAAFFL